MAATKKTSRFQYLELQDIGFATLLFCFAAFSLIWADMGRVSIAGHSIPLGYLVAPVDLLVAFLILSLGRHDTSKMPRVAAFFRTFYPQALFGPLFTESIILSGAVAHGTSWDGLFARMDEMIFGFQPARAFSAAFADSVAMNELMFGSYFAFFAMLVITPWLSWFRHDEEETRREMAAFSAYTLVVYLFYVFFRVMGPKYYLPDLHEAWYYSFKGGIITAFFREAFKYTILSGAAFPSSHVAISAMMAVFAARRDKRLLILYVPLTVLVCMSTVYIYAHWFVDIIGGFLAIGLLLPIFDALYPRARRVLANLQGRGARTTEEGCARMALDNRE